MVDNAMVWVGSLRLENATQSFKEALSQVSKAQAKLNTETVRTIAIKINICDYRRAESGAITHPRLLAALLDVLHERYPQAALSIIENDATTVDMWAAYRLLGFDLVAREHGAELSNVAEGKWVTRRVPDGIVLKELEVPEILETCDLFINFAKLKTNALTKTTGCLKNIFALLRMKRKVILHGQIDQVLHDMNKVITPDLCLVDGYIGMEGMGGPAFGRPKRCELVVAGANPVAVDACCARIMGFRPPSIKHIKLCYQAGLGPIDYQLQTNIPDFDYRRYKFQFPAWEYQLRNLARSRAGFAT
jgi:uncharacterized protein (DUF362 family)